MAFTRSRATHMALSVLVQVVLYVYQKLLKTRPPHEHTHSYDRRHHTLPSMIQIIKEGIPNISPFLPEYLNLMISRWEWNGMDTETDGWMDGQIQVSSLQDI